MESWLVPVVVSLITALSITIPGIYVAKRQAERDKTDRASAINDMAIELLAPVRSELAEARKEIAALKVEKDKLEERLDDLEFENGNLKRWAEALCCQVKDMGGTPIKFDEKTRPR